MPFEFFVVVVLFFFVNQLLAHIVEPFFAGMALNHLPPVCGNLQEQ